MACGVHKNDMIVWVGPQNYDHALSRPHTHVFNMTGHPMAGWVMVAPQGCASGAQLNAWVDQGVAFASSLPPGRNKKTSRDAGHRVRLALAAGRVVDRKPPRLYYRILP